jgi:Flp pilus assembly protein TadB
MRSPPVSVTCTCGNAASVAYGEAWSCESCGRRFDTARIPEDEYTSILREMRRARLSVIGVAVGIAAVFCALAIFVSPSLFMLMPVVLAGWFIVYMPMWRRRLRRRARTLPAWELEAD